DDRVVGMVSAHDQPPFSIADRLSDPSILTRDGTRPLEVRLLALEPEERRSNLFFGLIYMLYDYAVRHGYRHIFISGVAERQAMYERLGFAPLGPAVGTGRASFIPMVLTIGQLPFRIERTIKLWESHLRHNGARMRRRPRDGEESGETAGGAEEVCLL